MIREFIHTLNEEGDILMFLRRAGHAIDMDDMGTSKDRWDLSYWSVIFVKYNICVHIVILFIIFYRIHN